MAHASEKPCPAGDARAEAPGAPRRALVHIGLNKTGSSTIQAWLLENRALLAGMGIAYDRMDGPLPGDLNMATGWPRLADALAGGDGGGVPDVAAFSARAEAAWSGPAVRQAVISSEYIADGVRGDRQLAAFVAWLGRRFDRVDYLLYLRDQTEWVASAYAQAIKTGGCLSVRRFVAWRGVQDQFALARRWHLAAQAAPGEARLHVRLLEPEALRGGDLLTDFAHLLGVGLEGTRHPGRRNESMSGLRLRALRWANALGDGLARAGLPGLRGPLAGATRHLDAGPPLRLAPALAAEVARLNAPSNERLRRWLFPERPILYPRSAALLAAEPPSRGVHAPA